MKEISQETIEKISQTKIATSRHDIMKGIDSTSIPKQSETKLAIPSHRTRKQITFEQFLEEVKLGATLPELCQKYSKHLMAFYSLLSRGKITLSKEQFESDYANAMSLNEISAKHGISRQSLTYLREYYGIKRKGATYIRRLKNEQPLSQEAKDVIVGSLLGDGHITPNGYFSEKHSEKQVEYLEWKASFLTPVLGDKAFTCGKYFDERTNNICYSFCIRTATHSFFHEMRKKFYKEANGEIIKIVPEDIGEFINELVLAVWFMDDGSTDWGYKNGIKKYAKTRGYSKFSSQSFSCNEQGRLANVLKNKFNIDCSVMPRDQKHHYLSLSCDGSEQLFNKIRPKVHPQLRYKISETEYRNPKTYDKETVFRQFVEKHGLIVD